MKIRRQPPIGPQGTFACARFLFLRGLGLVYLVAFAGMWVDGPGLIGADGLLPAGPWVDEVLGRRGVWEAMTRAPSLFWLTGFDDGLLRVVTGAGVLLAALVLLGLANVPMLATLWALYFSIVTVGQRWFHFGWESQLLETGLLACFLVPLWDPRPSRTPPSRIAVVLGWWLIARIMWGAGMIKLRGSPCWTELTCLDFHFQTQPIPGPLSRFFHRLPHGILAGGVIGNHVVELLAPCAIWGPRRLRHLAGAAMIAFQGVLILSGNLSFLNWLTILPALLLLDDRLLAPGRARGWRAQLPASRARSVAAGAYALLVAWLSIPVVANILSPGQSMNRSFDPLRIVNTYGAFGSVGEQRWEIAVEGTADDPADPAARWQEFVFKAKPGPLDRRPPWLSPWHQRLDWLAWFAGLEAARGQGFRREAWVVHLLWKLLEGEPVVRDLLAPSPFADEPPRAVRVRLFEYRFAEPGDGWWTRDGGKLVVPPMTRGDPRLRAFLQERGWLP